MTNRLIPIIAASLLVALTALPLAADPGTVTVTFGGASGWARLDTLEGLTTAPGRLGRTALVLDSGRGPAPEADLLFSFDSPSLSPLERDETGNYRVVSGDLRLVGSAYAYRGSGSALSAAGQSALVLAGNGESLFGGEKSTGSFTIEFWMRPATAENGTEIFRWQSSVTEGGQPRFQYLRCGIRSNKMEWNFSNIWSAGGKGLPDVTLRGATTVVPGAWSHHRLSYDAETGSLSYRMNGILETIRRMTDDGTERGSVYPSRFGKAAQVDIASNYAGYLDEFAVLRYAAEPESVGGYRDLLDRYSLDRGRFVTSLVDTGGPRSKVLSFSAEQSLPGTSGTAFFIRAAATPWEFTEDSPRWLPLESGKAPPETVGRFVQISGELYPDGNGALGPSVTSVSLTYERDSPPWPPLAVFAEPGDARVSLSWKASPDGDAAGYLVYYGEHPGEYLCEGSPLDAGPSLRAAVEGLKNGRAYYFAVAAYDAGGRENSGPLSDEVYARPRPAPAAGR